MSPQPSTSCRRKVVVVKFCHHVHAKRHLHHKDYTDQERTAVWVTEKEAVQIREDARASIRTSLTHNLPVERGLECRTKSAHLQRTLFKQEARDAVLDEQESQRALGLYGKGAVDANFLALAYLPFCKKAQQEANDRGAQDALDAQEEQSEVSNNLETLTSSSFLSASSADNEKEIDVDGAMMDDMSLDISNHHASASSSCRDKVTQDLLKRMDSIRKSRKSRSKHPSDNANHHGLMSSRQTASTSSRASRMLYAGMAA